MTHFFIVAKLDMKALVETLEDLLIPILEAHRCDLVDIEIKGKPGDQIVRAFVDAPGGISLGQCENISREFSEVLDMEDVMPGAYRLEVSSPGLTRPLKSPRDFARNMNRKVNVFYETGDGNQTFQGEIVSVSDETLHVQGKRETRAILFSKIRKGKLTLPW